MLKKIIFFITILLLYQTPSNSKSTSFNNIDLKNLSKYFSGIVAFENEDTLGALKFFNSSKSLIKEHNIFLKRYVFSLVLENKISQAIDIVKINKSKKNTNFFDAHLLLIVESLKKDNFNQAYKDLNNAFNFVEENKLNSAILETLEQYIFTFRDRKIQKNKKNFGKLSLISETFQRCYLNDEKIDKYFSKLINDNDSDYTRYIYFYLGYLIENNRIEDAKKISNGINYINTTLLLSQGKDWLDNSQEKKFGQIFSCRNHNDLIGEFLFLISNLHSSQNDFKRSNFYLHLSSYLNPKFKFNLSLIAENHFSNGDFKKAKKILKKFQKEDNFYYWYRLKKEAQIISKQKNKNASLNFIVKEFQKIEKPNDKFLFDIANFYKNAEDYENAIQYYTEVIDRFDKSPEIKADLLYRRGGSFERIKNYQKSDEDLLRALKIKPDDAYILNYLAYSWLERDFKILEAMEMLEKAYELKSNDPYIIDSIGWAHYLIDDYIKAEKFLKRAVELMPDDPIVNDHYGDILWKLNRKIQARYFWSNVLEMKDADMEMIKNINTKMIDGLKS